MARAWGWGAWWAGQHRQFRLNLALLSLGSWGATSPTRWLWKLPCPSCWHCSSLSTLPCCYHYCSTAYPRPHFSFPVSLRSGKGSWLTGAGEVSEQGLDITTALRGACLGSRLPLFWSRLLSLCPLPSFSPCSRPHNGETPQITDSQTRLWSSAFICWRLPCFTDAGRAWAMNA